MAIRDNMDAPEHIMHAYGIALALASMTFGGCTRHHTEASPRTVGQWVVALARSYDEGGYAAFATTRGNMIRAEQALKDDADYEIASMVLGLSRTAVGAKESDLYDQIRELAEYVETHEHRSREQWQRLSDKLESYWYGNGHQPKDAAVEAILILYGRMAQPTGA